PGHIQFADRLAEQFLHQRHAALPAFAVLLGAKAWCALDQVPADRPYSMAAIVASALQNGIHPREWERYQTQMRDLAGELDESFVPKPPEHQRDVPRTRPTTDRSATGR
ncbi:hypothetical protein, partial [Nocardia salmonicida]|uniref:hypothetical protein n=1 Tax=Nocardia salmonicida TaxID=53431 RepID=UPI0033FF536F